MVKHSNMFPGYNPDLLVKARLTGMYAQELEIKRSEGKISLMFIFLFVIVDFF